MADGITHHKYLAIGWYFAVPFGILLYVVVSLAKCKYAYLYPLFYYINYLLCNVIDPDSDQLGLTSGEGITLRTTKKFYLGFFGALFVAYGFIYSYIIGLFGGHRSWLSHGWFIGTLFRMIYFDAPFFYFIWNIYAYGLTNWGWNTSNNPFYYFLFMNIWVIPLLVSQFLAWFTGDSIHLILDTEWAKGKLYTPIKTKRNG